MEIEFRGNKLTLKFVNYSANNQIAIQGWQNINDAAPYAVFTRCFPDSDLKPDETALDTNNCPEILEILKDTGIVEETDEEILSGYCVYPVVKVLKQE